MKAIVGAFNEGTVKSNIDSSWSGPAQCSTRLASTGDSPAWEERTDWAPLPIFVSGELEEINSPASVMSQGGDRCYGCYGLLWVGQSTALLLTNLAEMKQAVQATTKVCLKPTKIDR